MAGTRRWLAVALTTTCVLAMTPAAEARLDPRFGGGDGKVQTNISRGDEAAWAVTALPNGKLVVAGGVEDGGVSRFAVIRYGDNGELDRSFGGDGIVVTDVGPGEDLAQGVTFDRAGRIIAVGVTGDPDGGGDARFAAVRYQPGGGLDPTFGGDGRVIINVTPRGDSGREVRIDGRGRILIAGQADNWAFGAVRLRPGGGLDRSFGGDGKTVVDVSSRHDSPQAMELHRGRAILAGGAGFGRPGARGDGSFAIVRLDRDGTRDEDFGGDGVVRTQFSRRWDIAVGVTVDRKGRIVAAGGFGPGGYGGFAVARYRRNGRLDPSFGGDGRVRTDVTPYQDQAADVEVRGSRVVVSGDVGARPRAREGNIGVVRYRADGAIDRAFGRRGTVVTSFGPGWDFATQSAEQGRRGVVVVGGADNGATFAVARYRT